jgi:uncharacterized protein YkwD
MAFNTFITSFLFGLILLLIENPSHAQEDIKSAMLEEVNKIRAEGCKCGSDDKPPVHPLEWSEQLEKAASKHADDMLRNNYFSHTGSDKSVVDDRVENTGYQWTAIGENIAKGQKNAEDVVAGWKNSPGHCSNIMDAGFAEMGAAHKGSYWVLVFANRR